VLKRSDKKPLCSSKEEILGLKIKNNSELAETSI